MYETVDEYLNKLSNAEAYTKLSVEERQKAVFTAEELLKDHFPTKAMPVRAIALQVLYTLEGESEEFSKYKRHGVKAFATKGLSIQFEGSGISPDVINIINPNKAFVGSLI
ncbi:hypothetical protein [Niallia sp. 03190]|uniref:hypothetical protein n=1 Tax=Niallia sp. 03190 TaxID=3458061 RepID=UPI0040449DF9